MIRIDTNINRLELKKNCDVKRSVDPQWVKGCFQRGLFIVSFINSLTSIIVCGQGHFAVRPFIYYISRYYIYDNAYTMTNNLNIIDNSHIFLLSFPFLLFFLFSRSRGGKRYSTLSIVRHFSAKADCSSRPWTPFYLRSSR